MYLYPAKETAGTAARGNFAYQARENIRQFDPFASRGRIAELPRPAVSTRIPVPAEEDGQLRRASGFLMSVWEGKSYIDGKLDQHDFEMPTPGFS